ncbi:hypothetical protein ABFS83_04G049400 [Erythranthe nasuta]
MELKRVVGCFIGVLCIAFLFSSVAVAKDTLIIQGLCSKYPNCNKHCRENGFKEFGGKCVSIETDKKGPLFCVCITH